VSAEEVFQVVCLTKPQLKLWLLLDDSVSHLVKPKTMKLKEKLINPGRNVLDVDPNPVDQVVIRIMMC
jgi:hypothetical protein